MATRHLFDQTDFIDKGIRCKARTKSCSKCGYRYTRGDKSWHCPQCHNDRRCHNACVRGSLVCRLHGARRYAMATKADKHYIATNISRAYNRILNSPEILSLSQEIAMLGSQITELQMRIEEEDPNVSIIQIRQAINILNEALATSSMQKVSKAVLLLDAATSRSGIVANANREIREIMELQRKLVAQEQVWFKENNQSVPVPQVLEALVAIQRAVLKYLPDPADRAAFLNEIRYLMPTKTELRDIQLAAAQSKNQNGATALLASVTRK